MVLRINLINQIEEFLRSRNLSLANVCLLMQSIRVLLEVDQNSNKYPVTKHYCNWLLHKELDKSNSPLIIQEIADSFQLYSSKNNLIKRINDAVSMKKLITELKTILWTNMPDKKIVSQMDFEEYWIKFLQITLSQIRYRPLKLKSANVHLDGFDFSIYGIQIVTEKDHFDIELLSKELELKGKRILISMALFEEK